MIEGVVNLIMDDSTVSPEADTGTGGSTCEGDDGCMCQHEK